MRKHSNTAVLVAVSAMNCLLVVALVAMIIINGSIFKANGNLRETNFRLSNELEVQRADAAYYRGLCIDHDFEPGGVSATAKGDSLVELKNLVKQTVTLP